MWEKINFESEKLYLNCINKNLTITTSESCTGGMISSAIVHINGSSQIFKSSVITLKSLNIFRGNIFIRQVIKPMNKLFVFSFLKYLSIIDTLCLFLL